jgi:hypothetical protein
MVARPTAASVPRRLRVLAAPHPSFVAVVMPSQETLEVCRIEKSGKIAGRS